MGIDEDEDLKGNMGAKGRRGKEPVSKPSLDKDVKVCEYCGIKNKHFANS